MNIATQQKEAADSTAPASPDASQASEELAADPGEVTAADVAAALGLLPEGQEADGDEEGDTQDQGAAPVGADTAEGDDDQDDTPDKSEEGADPGDTAPAAGESTTTEEPGEATEAKPKNEHFQQRINELTAEKKGAQEEAAQLREKLSTYQARESGGLGDSALEAVESPEELRQIRTRYFNLQKWALANPDGGSMPDGKGGETEFTREEVARIHAQTFELLNESVPQREQYLTQRAGAEAEAARSYPWLSERTKGDGLAVQQAIEGLPIIRKLPGYRLVAANAFVGEKLRRAGVTVDDALIARLVKEQQAKKPAATARPAALPPRAPAAPGRTGSIPPRRTPAQAEIRAQEKRLSSSSGSVDDLANSIAAKLQPARR